MAGRVTRRTVLGGLGAVALPRAIWANAPEASLRPRVRGDGGRVGPALESLDGLIRGSGLSGAVACAVADVGTGAPLEAMQGGLGLPPASVAKLLTALYALDVLGPDHRFATLLVADGEVSDGVLRGDLILAGGGDPTLDTNGLARLARDLKATGIREVRGAFRVDDGALPYVRSIDAAQPDHLGYSPAVSGIALNYNRVHFEWRPAGKGYAVTMDARSDKYRPEVHMARMKVENRDLPVYTYAGSASAETWTVASRALGQGGARWLPVRLPALYAGDVFATLAGAHGIVLKTPQAGRDGRRAAGVVVARLESEALRDILRDMLRYSTNLTAEMVGMTASAAQGAAPATLAESAGAMSGWAAERYGMTGTRMVDHSGLGDASRMTAEDLVGALVRVRRTGMLRPLLKPYAMRDAKGRVIDTHPIRVDAKTGTLNFVSGLGGFLTAPGGAELAFAIFSADADQRARLDREDREVPPGARDWNRKAKQLQQKLIERWGKVYGG